ncbi:MAG: hypothetical protein JST00_24160 [Deltaproteobacteria bacterium]|nr:hypothetical protein [Deltaproteobacteria bacterium]
MTQDARELEDVVRDDDEDRPSITEVNGTVAKFEMAYNPERAERFAFGPPIWARVPGLLFLAAAAAAALLVFTAYHSSSNSSLFIWVVEGDRHRQIGSGPFSVLMLVIAALNALKTELRGVIVTGDAIETRDIRLGGMPSVKRFTWAQVDRVVIDDDHVMLELWNGTYDKLPRVHRGRELADLLARIATARGRAVTRLPSASAA